MEFEAKGTRVICAGLDENLFWECRGVEFFTYSEEKYLAGFLFDENKRLITECYSESKAESLASNLSYLEEEYELIFSCLPNLSISDEKIIEIADKAFDVLGVENRVPVIVEDSAESDPQVGGGFNARLEVIEINKAIFASDDLSVEEVVWHEVWHCRQQEIHPNECNRWDGLSKGCKAFYWSSVNPIEAQAYIVGRQQCAPSPKQVEEFEAMWEFMAQFEDLDDAEVIERLEKMGKL